MGKEGEYAILDEQGEFPIAKAWKKVVEDYIPTAYPKMKLDGALTETGAGDPAEVDSVKSYLAAHPNLKGLIGLVQIETFRHREHDGGLAGNVATAPTPSSAATSKAALPSSSSPPTRTSSATSQPGRPTTCSPATTSGPAPTRSAARSASSTTTPTTRSCGSASR